MNPSPGAVAPKLKIILVLLAAVTTLAAVGASVTATAGATDGGVSASGGSGDGSSDGGRYKRIWQSTSRHDKRWARKTSECESGRDPNAIGGGGKYRGAFQFMKSTWHDAPRSPGGDPIDYGLRTQSVVAVKLKHRMGTKPWPVCG